MNTFSRDLRLIVLLGYPYDCVTFAKITQKIHPTLKLIIFKKKTRLMEDVRLKIEN